MAGEDASKERYLAFLSQIVNISKAQVKNHSDFKPIIMIFTPTSWLIPRPTYIRFRKEFDKHFKYESGFLIKSDEFFKLKGRWPLAFTIWSYYFNENGNKNALRLKDFTFLTKNDLAINWHAKLESVNRSLKAVLNKAAAIGFSNIREDIRLQLPFVKDRFGKNIRQTRYDFSTAKKEKEYGKLISGFPLKDEERHYKLQRKCGVVNGTFVGFMDDLTPVRVENDTLSRMSNQPEMVWLQLRPTFIDINLTKIFNGPPDKYGYCVNDLESAKACFLWFAITKAVNGRYPIWANQFDIWSPKVKKARINYFYSLCFALGLAENRCVVTKFEKDNPVKGAPEVFVDNPLCPTNPESFWNKTLANEITSKPGLAKALVKEITDLYELWNKKYCKGQIIQNVGLEDEPYFKYFDYPDFVTPFSGLIQIKKYAEHNNGNDLTERLKRITEITKQVKNEIYTILVKDCKYFS